MPFSGSRAVLPQLLRQAPAPQVSISLFPPVPWDPSHRLSSLAPALEPPWGSPSWDGACGTLGCVGEQSDLFPALRGAGHRRIIIVEPAQCSSREPEPRNSWVCSERTKGSVTLAVSQAVTCAARTVPSHAMSLSGEGWNRISSLSIVPKSGTGRFSSTGKYPGEQLTAEQFLKGFEKQAAT